MQDLYREINSNSRFVAVCVRSLEKENSTKVIANEQQQPKSLDYSEHDSLVSTITTTSTESKRSENVLKPNALERRYHLLYLRAFEIQCMFEGLLDKRNFLLQSEEFQQQSTDTSDEEPIAKIPKFNFDLNFISHKQQSTEAKDDDQPSKNNDNGKQQKSLEIECDGDADFEDSEVELEGGDMECIATIKSSDCVDSIIVPVKKSLKESPVKEIDKITTTPQRVNKPKDFSKFNRSNRKSKNCAIFYYKHKENDEPSTVSSEDDDDDDVEDEDEEDEEEVWEYSNSNGNNETEIVAATRSDDKIEKIDDEIKLENNNNNNNRDSAKSPSSHHPTTLSSNASNTSKVIQVYVCYLLSLKSYLSLLQYHL